MAPRTSALDTTLLRRLCRYIESNHSRSLSLKELSSQVQLSPSYLQRRFKALLGVSPKEYLEAVRLTHMRRELRGKDSITNALYTSGFGAPSRLYERVNTRLGMTPKQYRAKGVLLTISYASCLTPLGHVLLGATDRGLCFLQFGDSLSKLEDALRNEFANAKLEPMPPSNRTEFKAWMASLSQYLKGRTKTFEVPLDPQGTAFQLKVWKFLQSIPHGNVRTYKEVAEGISKPTAVRAVASACARNHIAIAIPCHRVLRGTGALGGYRWGIARKKALLELESDQRTPRANKGRKTSPE